MDKRKAFKAARDAFSGCRVEPCRLQSSVAMTVDDEEVVLLVAHETGAVIVLYGKDIANVLTSCKIAEERTKLRRGKRLWLELKKGQEHG